nr:MAG TPA: Lower collar protein [Podoviridae sp. ct1Pw90]
MTSKYTLQLYYIYKDDSYNLFDQPYNLYNNELKPYFEEKFFQHFMFYEIGFDNINIFKQHLISTLNDIYPKYKQLYETEIRCQNIDFMLNKDLKESYVRKLNGESEGNSHATSNTDNISNSNDLSIANDTPQNKVDDLDKYMTSASKSSSNSTNNSTSNANNTIKNKSNNTEEYELISQGNIGVTSSAELLEKWRNVLINIDLMIFKELENLFLFVF